VECHGLKIFALSGKGAPPIWKFHLKTWELKGRSATNSVNVLQQGTFICGRRRSETGAQADEPVVVLGK